MHTDLLNLGFDLVKPFFFNRTGVQVIWSADLSPEDGKGTVEALCFLSGAGIRLACKCVHGYICVWDLSSLPAATQGPSWRVHGTSGQSKLPRNRIRLSTSLDGEYIACGE